MIHSTSTEAHHAERIPPPRILAQLRPGLTSPRGRSPLCSRRSMAIENTKTTRGPHRSRLERPHRKCNRETRSIRECILKFENVALLSVYNNSNSYRYCWYCCDSTCECVCQRGGAAAGGVRRRSPMEPARMRLHEYWRVRDNARFLLRPPSAAHVWFIDALRVLCAFWSAAFAVLLCMGYFQSRTESIILHADVGASVLAFMTNGHFAADVTLVLAAYAHTRRLSWRWGGEGGGGGGAAPAPDAGADVVAVMRRFVRRKATRALPVTALAVAVAAAAPSGPGPGVGCAPGARRAHAEMHSRMRAPHATHACVECRRRAGRARVRGQPRAARWAVRGVGSVARLGLRPVRSRLHGRSRGLGRRRGALARPRVLPGVGGRRGAACALCGARRDLRDRGAARIDVAHVRGRVAHMHFPCGLPMRHMQTGMRHVTECRYEAAALGGSYYQALFTSTLGRCPACLWGALFGLGAPRPGVALPSRLPPRERLRLAALLVLILSFVMTDTATMFAWAPLPWLFVALHRALFTLGVAWTVHIAAGSGYFTAVTARLLGRARALLALSRLCLCFHAVNFPVTCARPCAYGFPVWARPFDVCAPVDATNPSAYANTFHVHRYSLLSAVADPGASAGTCLGYLVLCLAASYVAGGALCLGVEVPLYRCGVHSPCGPPPLDTSISPCRCLNGLGPAGGAAEEADVLEGAFHPLSVIPHAPAGAGAAMAI